MCNDRLIANASLLALPLPDVPSARLQVRLALCMQTLYRLRWPQYLRQSFISVWQPAERRAVRITTRLVSASDRNVKGIHHSAAAASNTPVYYQARKAENKFVGMGAHARTHTLTQTRAHEQQMCRNGTNRCIMDLLSNRRRPH